MCVAVTARCVIDDMAASRIVTLRIVPLRTSPGSRRSKGPGWLRPLAPVRSSDSICLSFKYFLAVCGLIPVLFVQGCVVIPFPVFTYGEAGGMRIQPPIDPPSFGGRVVRGRGAERLSVQALDVDAQRMVAAHNRWRAAVEVPILTYSSQLAASAQTWADFLKQTNQCRMRHSAPRGQYGENLLWASAKRWSNGIREVQKIGPEQVVDSWASERAHYDHGRNSCASGEVCGHYTQIVWGSTTMVGCGAAVCADTREQIWVCRYQPAGNWIGRAPY